MRLQLRDDTGAKIADLDDDAAPLAAYAPYNGYRIHVVDLDPSSLTSGGWLEDTSLVDKYKMSDEAYDKLDSKFEFPGCFILFFPTITTTTTTKPLSPKGSLFFPQSQYMLLDISVCNLQCIRPNANFMILVTANFRKFKEKMVPKNSPSEDKEVSY